MNSVKLQYTKSIYKKSVVFLHTNNELLEREIRNTIQCTIASKKNKLCRNTFNQGGKRSAH